MSITVQTYTFTGDRNILDKTSIMIERGYQYITLPNTFERKQFKVPMQLGNIAPTSIPFNYMFISNLGYYFVEDIEYGGALSSSNNIPIYILTLTLDVLMTYRTQISRSIGTLVSTEKRNSNVYMNSAKFNTDVRKESELIYFDNPFEDELQNVLLTVASRGSY